MAIIRLSRMQLLLIRCCRHVKPSILPHIGSAMLTRNRSRDVKEATNLKEATKIASLVRNQTDVSYSQTDRRTGTYNLIYESAHVVVHAM